MPWSESVLPVESGPRASLAISMRLSTSRHSLLTSSSKAAGLSDSSVPSGLSGVRHFWQYIASSCDQFALLRGGCGVWGCKMRLMGEALAGTSRRLFFNFCLRRVGTCQLPFSPAHCFAYAYEWIDYKRVSRTPIPQPERCGAPIQFLSLFSPR